MRYRTAAAALVALVAAAPQASAEPRSATRDGRTLTVANATDLPAAGVTVRVTGRGYDRSKGIYVAFCVDNGPGKLPTPCGGGADTEGSSGNSVWISDLPPAYGTGLAKPYGDGGTFDVEIRVAAQLRADDPDTEADETVDCRTTRCAVVTRNDHTRSEDRSQDVAVPVSFAAAGAGAAPAAAGARPVAAAPVTEGTPAAAPRGASASPSAPATEVSSPPGATAPAGTAASASSPAAVLDGASAADAPVAAADRDGLAPVAVVGAAVLPLLAAAGIRGWRRRRAAPGA